MTWQEIKDGVSSVGLWLEDAGGIGDRLQFSSIPENFYRNTGIKLQTRQPIDCLIRNPYVEISQNQPDLIIDPWFGVLHFNKLKKSYKLTYPKIFRSLAEKHLIFSDFALFLNRPRLYFAEEAPTTNLCLIHRTGRTVGELPDDVVNYITEKYKIKGFLVGQIGGLNDKKIENTEDFRGKDLFQTAALIAQASVFIGINSGMYHLASCYNVQKKIILNQYKNTAQLENFFPLAFCQELTLFSEEVFPQNSIWLDFNAEYFNLSNRDIGITRALHNI